MAIDSGLPRSRKERVKEEKKIELATELDNIIAENRRLAERIKHRRENN